MSRFKIKLIHTGWLAAATLALVALIALPTFAQSLDTGLGSMSAIGLGGGGDIRILIAKIIRVLLGFLGIVAVVIVLYGGYLWMTAGGNEEQINTAKKVLINGLIGLVIILSAYAIVYFFITRLLVATDDTSCSIGETRACTVSGCTGVRNCVDLDGDGKFNFGNCIVGSICNPADKFSVRAFSPKNENNNVDRNTVVRVYFNKTFKTDTVTTNTIKLFDITDENSPVEVIGTVIASGSSIAEFRPSTACPSPRESDFCFSKDTPYLIKTIDGASGIIATDGVEQLTCSPTPPYYCESEFITNDRLDIKAPRVSILKPGNSAPVDSDVNFKALATDNGGVSQMSFYVGNNLLETVPNTGADSKKLQASTNWLTTGLPLFSKYNLKVDALDLDSNTGSENKDVTIVAQHCFNNVQDKDESGIDCGGSGCLACGGEICSRPLIPACSPNACASNVCNGNDPLTCTCAESPVISNVDPNNGASGNYITIFGKNFKNVPGKVWFLGGDGDGDGDAKDDPALCLLNDIQSINPVGDTADDSRVQMTSNGQGVWMAVWSSKIGAGDFDILYSVSEDNGISWSTPQPLNINSSVDTGNDERPDIATANNGTWVAVWDSTSDVDGKGTDTDILYATSINNGLVWSAPKVLNSWGVGDSDFDRYPDIKADANNFVVGWVTGKYGDRDIAYSYSTDNGASWSSGSALNSNALTDIGSDGALSINTDGSGNWVAVWHSNDSLGNTIGTDRDIFVARSSNLSAGWTAVTYLNDNAPGVPISDAFPVVATDKKGAWITAWSRGPNGSVNIYYSVSLNNGATWSSTRQLAANVADDQGNGGIELRADPNGLFRAVWTTKEYGASDIATAISNNFGESWALKSTVNANDTGDGFINRYPQVESNGSGLWITSWESNDDNVGGQSIGSDLDILLSVLKSCDMEAALACSLASTWNDHQIIVEVPAGAETGPIEVVTDTGLSDRTDILPGTLIANFTVNATVRPGLCEVSPPSACFNDPDPAKQTITFKGKNFGATVGELFFGDAKASTAVWTPQQIQSIVPNINPATVGTRVKVNNEFSNPIEFQVLSCTPKPRIDSIKPETGPKKQTLTITGANFGSGVGEVYFVLGNTEVKGSMDFPIECGPSAYWKDKQVIVIVPDEIGADGLYNVYIKRQDGEKSNNDKTFKLVSTLPLAPGLFCLKPDNGPEGIAVDYIGNNFGSDYGLVKFYKNIVSNVITEVDAIIDEWKNLKIKTKVPVGAVTGPTRVIHKNLEPSNPLNFSVGSCLDNQNICIVGQVCCGDGSCRGSDDPTCLPPAIPDSSYRWRLTTGNPAPRVVEERACTVNALYNGDFEGGTDSDGAINWWGDLPDVYPATDFLKDVGGNHFYEQADCGSGCPYDDSILAQYVVVPRPIGGESFTLSFSARHNTANSPLRAKVVAADNMNRKIGDFAFSATGPLRLTTSWQRYTGSILVPTNETVDEFYLVFGVETGAQIDNVLLETTLQTTQSPSPWKGSTDACTNAQFSVRFSTKLKDNNNDGLLDKTVLELQSCGNDSSCATPGAKVLPISPPVLFTYMDTEGNELNGFTANLGLLQPNTWYQATVTPVVLSDKNVPMRTPYVWRFKTRAIPCAIAGLSCQPAKYTLKGLGSTISLAAGLTAVNCNILNCGTGDVNWSSSDADNSAANTIATVDTNWTSCNNIATAVGESPPVANISITSIKEPTARPGKCQLTVVFNEFNVEEVYPACETACTNAAIGAVFSVSLKTSTASSTTVKLEKCTEQTCVTSPIEVENLTFQAIPFTRPDGKVITDGELQISLPTGELLDINTYYQVTLVGGESGLKSVEGKELKNTNGIVAGVPVYRWIFKTTDKQCEAKKLIVTPGSATVQTIGAKQSYFSQPYSAPDSCSSRGQRLNASSFDYGWSSNKISVATVTNDNIMPPTVDDPLTSDNEARIDPLQKATAIGTDASCNKAEGSYKCKADIESKIKPTTIADSGEFILQCGYSKSGRCAFYCNSNKKCLGDNTRSCVTNDDCRPLCNTTSGKCSNSGNVCSTDADCTTVKAGLCTNENKSCNTDVDCTTDASSNKLNLCGGGTPVGGCTVDNNGDSINDHCGNDRAVECLDANGQPDNKFCNFSTNDNSCCGARPWVETITGSVSPIDGSICRNTAFVVTFNSLMDRYSVENNIFLEWLAPDSTCDYQATIDKYNEEHVAIIQQNWWKKIWSFVTKITYKITAQGTETWCRVPSTTVFAGTVTNETGVPIKTKAILSVSQLLYDIGSPDYRVVVAGEDASNVLVGAKNIYGIKIDKNLDGTDYSKNFEIGDHVCKVERVDVEIAPLLPLDIEAVDPQSLTKPHDLFSCFGDNCSCSISTGSRGCRLTVAGQQSEDQVPLASGNQHRYFATAKDVLGQSLSSNYKWFDTELPNVELDPQDLIELNVDTCDAVSQKCKYHDGACSTDADCVRPPEQFLMTKESKNGFASVRVKAELGNDPNTIGQQTVPITVFLCKNRWDGLKDGPSDADTNFYTTYCRDTGKFDENNIEIPLPYFVKNPITISANNNPLNILKEWILKDESSVDAVGVRVVGNERHLTPAEWYNEQPITKGSPQTLAVDGFSAIRDGRTIYIGAGNAVNDGTKDVLYTNIYILSHNQGAKATTINIFNQLIGNAVFSINQLSGGSCTNKVNGDFATKSCAINSDCAEGFTCNSNKKCENKTNGTLARESCLFDKDCANGFICNNTKSAIARDVKRLNDAMEMTVYLADYRYGTGCQAVTPGAPGDANCNGVINGSDIILATYYKTHDMPSYCFGADYDGSTIVDDTDVGLIKNVVQTYCKRPPLVTTNYPSLSAGTYITGSSTSRWPSWVATLGNDLGHQLPVDPLNYFAQCEAGGTVMLKHDLNTCWDEVSKTYASHYATLDAAKEKITKVEPPPDVPDGNPQSRVYTYSSYGRCSNSTEADPKACITDSQCPAGETCQSQGQDYAVCTFFERSYTPEPAVLGQNTGGNRVCLITSGALVDALPSPPAGTIPDGGIIPPESNTYELIVNITGSGAGSVVTTGSGPGKTINKPALATVSVTYYLPKNEPINMVATAVSPANIGPWGGSVCSGVGTGSTCEFTLNSNKIVNLSFITEVSLMVKNTASKGGATVNINGYNCTIGPGSLCGRPFDRETTNVSATVTPDSFSDFVGWQNCTDFGTESGNTCSGITMDINKELRVELAAKAPVINSFVVAGAGSLVSDQDFTTTWTTTNATSISIISNEGSINASGLNSDDSKVFRAKNGMNKLTLTATGPGGSISQDLTVIVNDPTVINSFSVSPNPIEANNAVTLNWNISGTVPTSLVLEVDSNTIPQTAAVGAGSTTHTPTTTGNKTYKLIADGPGGRAEAITIVDVFDPLSITTFRVKGPSGTYGPTAEVGTEDDITFEWATVGATSLSVDGNIGPDGNVGALSGAGGTKIFKVKSATTQVVTFTLTATGPLSSRTATVNVTVHRAPTVNLTAWDNTTNTTDDTLLIVDGGGTVDLIWTGDIEFGSIESFVPSPGSYDPNSQVGTKRISPSSPSSTTYTITVKGKFGSVTASHTVTVVVRSTMALEFMPGGSGTGSVELKSTRPTKVCTTNCNYYPNTGDNVTLTATPDPGSRFVGWTGCPSGSGSPCEFPAGNMLTITANFAKAYTLRVEKRDVATNALTKNGLVGMVFVSPVDGGNKWLLDEDNSSDPEFIEELYTSGTDVQLTAENTLNVKFDHWSYPACTTDTCPFTMDGNKTDSDTLIAYFLAKPTPIASFAVSPSSCSNPNTPCSPTQQFSFSWGGGNGATSFQLVKDNDLISPSTAGSTCWSALPVCGNHTGKLSGSGKYKVRATNSAGYRDSIDIMVWLTWGEQLLADGTVGNGNITGVQARHNEASPRVIVANDQDGNPVNDVAYVFFSGEGNSGTCRVLRGPTSGNAMSFTPATDIAQQCRHIAVWYDKWTPNITTDVGHIAVTRTGGGSANQDRVNYYTISNLSTQALAPVFRKVTKTAAPVNPFGEGEQVSVAERTNGDGFFALGKQFESYVDQCSLNNVNACTRVYANNSGENEATQAVPLMADDTLGSAFVFRHKQIGTSLFADIWQTNSSWTRMTVDNTVSADNYYSGAFNAVTDPTLGHTYVVYKHDGGLINSDDEIRMKVRVKNRTYFSIVPNSTIYTSSSNGAGFHDVTLALDTRSGYLYMAYAERKRPNISNSSIVRYRRSLYSTKAIEWSDPLISFPWTDPVTIIATEGEYRGISMNYLSQDRLYISAVDTTLSAVKLRGAIVNVLTRIP